MQRSIICTRRAVCFLDILGFRSLLEARPLAEVARDYDRLISTATALNRPEPVTSNMPQLFPTHPSNASYCYRFVFSDSVILVAKSDDVDGCLKLLVHAWRLVQAILTSRMSVRGAVACGEMYFDLSKGICLGKALTDAYELEQRQNWVGAAIDSSVERAYPEIFSSDPRWEFIFDSLFRKSTVPLKDREVIQARTLNWRWNLYVENGIRWLFPDSQEEAAQEKIDNALAYAKAVVSDGRAYSPDEDTCPVELRSFFAGAQPPPFRHGDEL